MHVDCIVHCLPLPFSTSQKSTCKNLTTPLWCHSTSPMMSFRKSHIGHYRTGCNWYYTIKQTQHLPFRCVGHWLSPFQDNTHVYCLDSRTALMYTVLIPGQHSCILSRFQDSTHVYCLDSRTVLMHVYTCDSLDRIEYSVMYFKCIRFSSCSTELASTKGGGHTAWMHEYLRCSWSA